MDAQVYTGKDHLRLEKNEAAAKLIFPVKLREAVNGEAVIYVISEKEHLPLLPDGSIRVLANKSPAYETPLYWDQLDTALTST